MPSIIGAIRTVGLSSRRSLMQALRRRARDLSGLPSLYSKEMQWRGELAMIQPNEPQACGAGAATIAWSVEAVLNDMEVSRDRKILMVDNVAALSERGASG